MIVGSRGLRAARPRHCDLLPRNPVEVEEYPEQRLRLTTHLIIGWKISAHRSPFNLARHVEQSVRYRIPSHVVGNDLRRNAVSVAMKSIFDLLRCRRSVLNVFSSQADRAGSTDLSRVSALLSVRARCSAGVLRSRL